MQGVTVNYAIYRTFASAFALDHILQLVLKNWGRMLLTVLIFVVGIPVLYIITIILALIPCLGWIAIWLILLGGTFYLLLVFAYNCGFIARNTGSAIAATAQPGTSTPPPSNKQNDLGGWG
jgi:hypothetical protein